MKFLISGSRGLIGSTLIRSLLAEGRSIARLTRPGGPVGAGSVSWSPRDGKLDADAVEGYDAVVHLSGENIGSRRWNEAQKQRIYDSRIHSTRLLCSRLKVLQQPPKVAIFASAVGYYGDRPGETLTEDSPVGVGFMSDVCRDWEKETEVLDGTGIRRVNLRIGVVMSPEGGALTRMLPIFRAGLGGRLGSGRQHMSWIGIRDLVRAIKFAVQDDRVNGPVNAVSPNPVTNAAFTKALSRAVRRPALFPVPAFAMRAVLGEVADQLLADTRAIPHKLRSLGFTFDYPDLENCLQDLLK